MSTVERRDSIESTAEGVWLLIDVKVKPDMIQATRQTRWAAAGRRRSRHSSICTDNRAIATCRCTMLRSSMRHWATQRVPFARSNAPGNCRLWLLIRRSMRFARNGGFRRSSRGSPGELHRWKSDGRTDVCLVHGSSQLPSSRACINVLNTRGPVFENSCNLESVRLGGVPVRMPCVDCSTETGFVTLSG
jgi:hypothetical protein